MEEDHEPVDGEMTDEPVETPITGELDLHTFRPKEVKDLVPDYLEACRDKGLREVRVVHGKGIGNLRRTVHAILDRLDYVESYSLAHEFQGSWGATMVWLRPLKGPGASRDSGQRQDGKVEQD